MNIPMDSNGLSLLYEACTAGVGNCHILGILDITL